MQNDRYGLPLSIASAGARDLYVQASDLALTFYPGAAEAYDAAIASEPGFALAHSGKAQLLMRQGDVAAARDALQAAREVAVGVSEREASHLAILELMFAGRTDAAIAVLYTHLASWPRDALIVAAAANPNGLIGGSGRIGQKRQIAVLMDSLAPHYGDDFWFMSYHAMALSEDGQLAAARPKIQQSLALNPNNAHGAHGLAHICYESGDPDTARNFLSSWLGTYPRDGFFYGHVSWHLSLCELQAGDGAEALRLFRDALTLDRHSGGPQQKVSDGAAFLWRSELAGHSRDTAAGAICTNTRRARCRGRAAVLLICTSSWPRLSWETMPHSTPVLARWKCWLERDAIRPALIFQHWPAASRPLNAAISLARSKRLRRSQAGTKASAAAAHNTISSSLHC